MSEYESLREDIGLLADSFGNYARTVNDHAAHANRQIKRLWEDNAELRDELVAVSNRLENLTRAQRGNYCGRPDCHFNAPHTHDPDDGHVIINHAEPRFIRLGADLRSVPFKCPRPDCFIPDPHEHHADGHMIFRGAAS